MAALVENLQTDKPAVPRPRRYGKQLEAAIYAATIEELIEVGFSRLSFDSIARRANTGKAALYRRWSSREELVIDAMVSSRPPVPTAVVSGELRTDLIEYFSACFVHDDHPHSLIMEAARRLVGDADRFPTALAAVVESIWRPGFRGLRHILQAAVERGEIEADNITPEILEVVPGVMSNRMLLNWGPATKRDVIRVVDRILLPALHHPPAEH